MTNVFLKYNSSKIETVIDIDGKELTEDSYLSKYKNEILDEWVKTIIPDIIEQINEIEFDMYFCGSIEDYEKISVCCEYYNENGYDGEDTNINLQYINAVSDENMKKIKSIVKKIEQYKYDEFKNIDTKKNKILVAKEIKAVIEKNKPIEDNYLLEITRYEQDLMDKINSLKQKKDTIESTRNEKNKNKEEVENFLIDIKNKIESLKEKSIKKIYEVTEIFRDKKFELQTSYDYDYIYISLNTLQYDLEIIGLKTKIEIELLFENDVKNILGTIPNIDYISYKMKGSKDIKNIVEENKNIEVEKIENTYYANISYIEGNKILEIIEKPYIKSLEKNLQNLNLHISKISNSKIFNLKKDIESLSDELEDYKSKLNKLYQKYNENAPNVKYRKEKNLFLEEIYSELEKIFN